MSTFVRFVSAPSRLQWWEWGKILGLTALVALIVLLGAGITIPPPIIAILLHVAGDFTFQSDETAARKAARGRHLTVHALVAGGLPMAAAGLSTGNPLTTLEWLLAGTAAHYLIDWTRKFGIRSPTARVILDQLVHVVTILIITQCIDLA